MEYIIGTNKFVSDKDSFVIFSLRNCSNSKKYLCACLQKRI